MASASSSSNPTRGLLDLPEDVLFLLLRVYVPLKEKLQVLLRIPEFRRLVTCREAYPLPAGSPISGPYVDFLQCIRPGWHVARDDPFHRFHLQINERTLVVSLHHYLLEGSARDLKSNDTLRFQFFNATVPHMRSNLLKYLENYYHCTEDLLLTCRLRGRFFAVRPNLHQVWFHDGRTVMIRVDQKLTLPGTVHFSVLLTRDRKLLMEHNGCDLQELSPIEFQKRPEI